LLIIAIVLGIRWIIFRTIRGKPETLTPEQCKWISSTRNIAIIIIFILLLSVWSLKLSRFALSIAVFALAIVIARKELTLCLLSGIYRTITHPFSVGDWIEVGPIRGEVLEEGEINTTLQEILPRHDTTKNYTGRTITMSNSMLLGHSVMNENHLRNFVIHMSTITSSAVHTSPKSDGDFVRKEVNKHWKVFEEKATETWHTIRKNTGVALRNPDPVFDVHTTVDCHIAITVQLFCPRDEAEAIEDHITTALLERQRVRREKKPTLDKPA
jgi:hypothetical protein